MKQLLQTQLSDISKPEVFRFGMQKFQKIVNKVQTNFDICGLVYDKTVCENGHENNIYYNCNLRICDRPKCVSHRSHYVRHELIEPLFSQINNCLYIVLTFKYENLPNDYNLVPKARACVNEFLDRLRLGYGIIKDVINVDVIKKGDSVFHLHFNIACDFHELRFLHDRNYFFGFQEQLRAWWVECSSKICEGSNRISINPKYKQQQKKSCLNYFVKRTAEINPVPKRGIHQKISIFEYVKFFYKRHFITVRYWSRWDIIRSNLVQSSNMIDNLDFETKKKCHICGSETFYSMRFNFEQYSLHCLPPNID